ncbi:MAG: PQQ-binding-like beta-propeller repeat protein [Chloroflexota bacterium]|nr:PQQ-binding-like beta-propeller repeat protein [Chloroflexota bacterium]
MKVSRSFGAMVLCIGLILAMCAQTIPTLGRADAVVEPLDAEVYMAWPMYGGNAQHTGSSSHYGPNVPKLEWSVDAYLMIQYCVPLLVGADDTLYAAEQESVLAIEADSSAKSVLWKGEDDSCEVYSIGLGNNGDVYIGASYDVASSSEYGVVYAISSDGLKRWQYEVDTPIYNPLVIGPDGSIYVSPHRGSLYAIDVEGQLKWKVEAFDCSYGGVAFGHDGVVYAASYNGLYAYSMDGLELWHRPVHADAPLAVAQDGAIYVVGYIAKSNRCLFALDSEGQIKWQHFVPYPDFHPAFADNGIVLINSGDTGEICAIDQDGRIMWTTTAGTSWNTGLLVDEAGVIYFGTEDGKLCALNPDGSIRWDFEIGSVVRCCPVMGSDGVLYVNAEDGRIYAVGNEPIPSKGYSYTFEDENQGTSLWIDIEGAFMRFTGPDGYDSGVVRIDSIMQNDGLVLLRIRQSGIMGVGWAYIPTDVCSFIFRVDGQPTSYHLLDSVGQERQY